MAKEGSTVSGLMDSFATTGQRGAPVRRAAARPGQQVRPRPVRAERLHGQPGDPDRQVDRGLHLPVARVAVPRPRRQGRRSGSSTECRGSRRATALRRASSVAGSRRLRAGVAPTAAPPADASAGTGRRPTMQPKASVAVETTVRRQVDTAGRTQPPRRPSIPAATASSVSSGASSPLETSSPSWPPTATHGPGQGRGERQRLGHRHPLPRHARTSRSRSRRTRRAAPNAARSWSATAAATSA